MVLKNYAKAIQNVTIILAHLALEMRSVRWCCLELHHLCPAFGNTVQWPLNVPFVVSVWWFDMNFVIKLASVTKLQFSMSEEMLFLVDREWRYQNAALLIKLHRGSWEFYCLTSFPLCLTSFSLVLACLFFKACIYFTVYSKVCAVEEHKLVVGRRLLVGKL